MPIIFLAVILKIPVLYGMWLIWWAVKDEPQVEDLPGESDDHSFRRFRRNPTQAGAALARPSRRRRADPAGLPAGRSDPDTGNRAPPRPGRRRSRAA